MSVPTRRILEPIYGEASLADAINGNATWIRGQVSANDQKGQTGWLADLYGGVQTGDDYARVNIPVYEERVPDFNKIAGDSQWTWNQTNAEVYGVNMVIWAHDPKDPDKRVEITQAPSHADLDKAAGWNSHELDPTVTQFFYFGENVTDASGTATALTAGTQYTWNQFREDDVFKTWTIYRVTLEWGWYSTGTFESAYVADIKLNKVTVYLRPDSGGSGRIGKRWSTATSGAMAATLAPKTMFKLLGVELKINTAGTTDESFTITKDSGIDAAYDRLLLTQNTKTPAITDLGTPFDDIFLPLDEIDCAWPNTENRTWGLTYNYLTVF